VGVKEALGEHEPLPEPAPAVPADTDQRAYCRAKPECHP